MRFSAFSFLSRCWTIYDRRDYYKSFVAERLGHNAIEVVLDLAEQRMLGNDDERIRAVIDITFFVLEKVFEIMFFEKD